MSIFWPPWTSRRAAFAAANLEPRPDMVVVGNAISRGNAELEHILDQDPLLLAAQILHEEFCVAKKCWWWPGPTERLRPFDAGVDLPQRRAAAFVPDWRDCGEFRQQLSVRAGKAFHPRGDEYDTAFFDKGPKFLHYFPDAIILTSVEFDHADIYKDLDAVETAFKRLVNLVPGRGRIVALDTGRVSTDVWPRRFVRLSVTEAARLPPGELSICDSIRHAPRGPCCMMASRGPNLSSLWPENTTC